MPERVNEDRLRAFMRAAGAAARREGVCYLTGGATAVLLGWRGATLDIDVRLEPEQDELMRRLPAIKHDLRINVETASPAEFIPLPDGWQERSPFAGREGKLTFRHFDLYAQALAKIERGHEKDRLDVAAMLERGLVDAELLREMFDEIEPRLYERPELDAASFRRKLEEALTAAATPELDPSEDISPDIDF